MNCRKCGAELEDGALFCSECGTGVESDSRPEEKQETFAAPTVEGRFNPYAVPEEEEEIAQTSASEEDVIIKEESYSAEVTPSESANEEAVEAKEPEKTKCRKCGAEMEEGALFCGVCGNKTTSEPAVTGTVEGRFNPYAVPMEKEEMTNLAEPAGNTVTKEESPFGEGIPSGAGFAEKKEGEKLNLKISKKKLIKIVIVAVCLLAVVAAVVTGIKVYSNYVLKKPIEIDLNDYVSDRYLTDQDINAFFADNVEAYGEEVEDEGYYDESTDTYYTIAFSTYVYGVGLPVRGYDGYAVIHTYDIYNIIDWSRFYSDWNAMISEKKGYEYTTFRSFVEGNDFVSSADKLENISNGDTVTVTVSSKETFTYRDVTVHIKNASHQYKIDNLKKVTAINPFDYVSVVHTGANGDGHMLISVNDTLSESIAGKEDMFVKYYSDDMVAVYSGDYIVAKIGYYFDRDSSTSRLSNGDTVTVCCSCGDVESLEEKYSLFIPTYSNTYTVNGLGEYITKNFDMSDDDLKKFRLDSYNRYMEKFGKYDDYSNVKFSCAYLADLKDKTANESYVNKLFVVFSYSYEDWWTGEKETRYWCTEYHNLITNGDNIEYGAESYYYSCDYDDNIAEMVTETSSSKYYNFRKIAG